MLKMTNGVNTITITEGAERVYASMGFRRVNTSKKASPNVKAEPVSEVKENDFTDLLEKPISQWNQKEIKDFASSNDIDVSKAKNIKQARATIKKFLDEQEKVEV